MTSNINFSINIPSLFTGSSVKNINSTTANDFTSYLLNTMNSTNAQPLAVSKHY